MAAAEMSPDDQRNAVRRAVENFFKVLIPAEESSNGEVVIDPNITEVEIDYVPVVVNGDDAPDDGVLTEIAEAEAGGTLVSMAESQNRQENENMKKIAVMTALEAKGLSVLEE